MGKEKDIKDDEIRIIGVPESAGGKGAYKKSLWERISSIAPAAAIVAIVAAICLAVWFIPGRGHVVHGDAVAVSGLNVEEPGDDHSTSDLPSENGDIPYFGNYSDMEGNAYTEHLRDTVNDIPLDIFIPHNASPGLYLGVPELSDRRIVFATRAADVRADNGKIVGAFVLDGQPLSWGLSKKGYCGIIDGDITIGVADNSPLFEEATEKGGCFFRQYPLVDNGVPVENAPKGKSIRKAVCDRNGEIMVVMSITPESFHDFSQALADMGIRNAIYLAGGTSFGYYRDKHGNQNIIHERKGKAYQYENFIIWYE